LPFTVKAGDLSFSIVIFSTTGLICITTLILRRYLSIFGKGELGGPTIPKFATGILFVTLWIAYIVVSALKSYQFF
jgi:solute carrier family 8 (sodium/calcium exchanger)